MTPHPQLLLGPLLALLAIPTLAISADRWSSANLAIVDHHVLPRYAQLASTTATLAERAQALCTTPAAAQLEALRSQFHTAMDAWQGISHLRFGPVTLFMRNYRFQLWPDKRNSGERHLNELLTAADPQALVPDTFHNGSVAVQGFGALERLLFEEGVDAADFGSAAAPSYRCQVTLAVADNLAQMAHEVDNEWRAGEHPYRQVIASSADGNDQFYGSEEATARFLNNLHTQLQVIVDQKLELPLDESAAKARGRRAESWRTHRSLRNVALDLAALEELYRVGVVPLLQENPAQQALAQRINTAFATTRASAEAVPQPLATAVSDPTARRAVEQLKNATAELKRLVGSELPPALGLPLGFNSLDGD